MATDTTSRLRQGAKLAVVLLVVGPALVQLGLVGADLASVAAFLPEFTTDLLVRVGGLAVVLFVVAMLIRQKRRTRGQANQRAPEEASDRQVEGTGEVYAPYAYNNQQQARREGKRIQKRAEEIAESDREARKRR